MIFLLDTSILIELLRSKPEAEDFLDKQGEETILISSICEAEIFEGIYREPAENFLGKRQVFQTLLGKISPVISFDSKQAEIAGRIRAELAIKGSLIGDLDILIAAAALSQSATLVTKNPTHFQKIPGLQVTSL